MKVLYVGNYKDGTGWANACINNILALDAAQVDVVPRAITFEKQTKSYPDKIKQLEQNSVDGCDICIQHTLPHLYSYDSNFKNIGCIATETDSFKETNWHNHANIMDEIWAPSLYTKASCRQSDITVPIQVAPYSLDISVYDSVNWVDMNAGNTIQELKHTFNFAFVGEFIERKNIQALLRAFHMEFHPSEPVNLFMKTSQQTLEYVQNYCKQIRDGLKIRKNYKQEIIICGYLDRKDYVSVLNQCHAFVMPSRGEAFCIPALEAMALGMPVIHTADTGMDDFCIGTSVQSKQVPCFGAMSSLPNMYTSNTKWSEIDVEELCIAMRNIYMQWHTEQYETQKQLARQKAYEYDHKVVGKALKELLNDS